MSCSLLESSILFQNSARTVILLDIPRSLEEAQVPTGEIPIRRIFSSPAVQKPFELPEPRNGAALLMALPPAALLEELRAGALVESAMHELSLTYSGPFCIPRVSNSPSPTKPGQDAHPTSNPFIPEGAAYLHGSIQDLRGQFAATAPRFDLIVVDPPWPNRSARRKSEGYAIASSRADLARTLLLLPVPAHLMPDGIVAVWLTNSHSARPLIARVLARWGLEPVADWVWLKITAEGKPVFPLDSCYRKPWERLLVARRVAAGGPGSLASKVLVAVPDQHSRKPNLRPVFGHLLKPGYCALEVFARNLTSGWWSWGDEVLRFQQQDQWTV